LIRLRIELGTLYYNNKINLDLVLKHSAYYV